MLLIKYIQNALNVIRHILFYSQTQSPKDINLRKSTKVKEILLLCRHQVGSEHTVLYEIELHLKLVTPWYLIHFWKHMSWLWYAKILKKIPQLGTCSSNSLSLLVFGSVIVIGCQPEWVLIQRFRVSFNPPLERWIKTHSDWQPIIITLP